jgi:HlyD family secretion protein
VAHLDSATTQKAWFGEDGTSVTRRTLVLIILLLLIPGTGGVLLYQQLSRPDPNRVATVRRGDIEATIGALGRVQPGRQIDISSRVSGTIQYIAVIEGQQVAEGDLLLELDARDQENAVAQAERNLRVRRALLEDALHAPDASDIDLARARLRRATAQRLNAQRDYDEIADEPDAESSDEAVALEIAKLEYEIARAEFDRVMEGTPEVQLERLRADVEEAEAALRRAQENMQNMQLRAPFAGTLLRINARVGENVHGFTPLVVLADLTEMMVRAEIDEIDVAAAAEGQKVYVRLDALPGQELEGRITRLMPGFSDARGTTTYAAIVELEDHDLPLRPGMGANLTIVTQTISDTLLVSRRAVRQAGRYHIVRVLDGRRERDVVVTVGLSNDTEIEILSGLESGQTVLLE